jgi:hypothetical protein
VRSEGDAVRSEGDAVRSEGSSMIRTILVTAIMSSLSSHRVIYLFE